MSIVAHLRQVSSGDIKGFEKDPSSAYDLILGSSLSNVRNTSHQVQAWKARNALTLLRPLLDRKQVVSVTRALMSFREKKFRQRFRPKEMKASKVYGVRGSGDFGYLWGYFQHLKAYYSQAVKRGSGMLCYFD